MVWSLLLRPCPRGCVFKVMLHLGDAHRVVACVLEGLYGVPHLIEQETSVVKSIGCIATSYFSAINMSHSLPSWFRQQKSAASGRLQKSSRMYTFLKEKSTFPKAREVEVKVEVARVYAWRACELGYVLEAEALSPSPSKSTSQLPSAWVAVTRPGHTQAWCGKHVEVHDVSPDQGDNLSLVLHEECYAPSPDLPRGWCVRRRTMAQCALHPAASR